ncbi:MAG: DNA translocase FtsK 4TM domain-containing protein [Planctomycetes bacterium]|nr:DNA translocase FtsK 4TM domain-containing protein [Planctomycetota bacterium]
MATRKNVKSLDSKSTPPQGGRGGARYARYAFILVAAGVIVLLWTSLLTFSPNDWPATSEVHPTPPISNRAGAAGAYVAYYLRSWLGGGAYVGLFFTTLAGALMLLHGRIAQLPFRILGVVLLTGATSSAIHLAAPNAVGGSWWYLSGILGESLGEMLISTFAKPGGWVVLTVVFAIAVIMSADWALLQLWRLLAGLWRRRDQLFVIGNVAKLWRRRRQESSVSIEPVTVQAPAVEVGASSRILPEPSRPVAADDAEEATAALEAAEKQTSPAKQTDYALPSTALLTEAESGYVKSQEEATLRKREILQQTLRDFNVVAEVVGSMTGPVITMFELSLAPGVKVAAVSRLAKDISRALAVPGVRVVSPLPGRDTIGIEVPNMEKEIVRLRELMEMAPQADEEMFLPLYLGKDAEGRAIVADLASMPHMLIAGTTGSGKSVCMNGIIMTMLLKRRPEEVRLILVDPKMVEMAAFENIPHLLCPIVNDMRRAGDILEWAVTKMDERYEILKEVGVKNIASFNKLSPDEIYERMGIESSEERARAVTSMSYYVIIVDELADLIMTSGKEVEGHIIRIAQKARAVGIHLILATQRPSVNVVTGLIKSNMPCRVSFRVASRQESRIVLDQNGAEVLLGQGDMLVLLPGTSNLVRAQGTFVDDAEIRTIVRMLRRERKLQFNDELMRLNSRPSGASGERDELFDKAVEIVLTSKRGSVSLLQRRLSIGYSRSSRIIDQMADAGILGDYKGSQARECLMDLKEWQMLQESIAADQSGRSSADGRPTSA